jgi:polyhydroxyalkanoate synthesis regulator phasin
MEPSEIAKQSLHLSRVTFDNTFNAMLLLEEQVQRMIDIYFHQILVFPEQGKKVADTWTEACRTNRDEFKKVVESNYEMLASFFKDAEKKSEN